MSLDFTDDQSTLVQVMAWCHQAISHYLSQCWPRSLLPYGVTRPQWVNVLIYIHQQHVSINFHMITSMVYCKIAVSALQTYWRYCIHTLRNWFGVQWPKALRGPSWFPFGGCASFIGHSSGCHWLEKCLNFNPSAWKVLEFVIGLEKEQNALKSAWKFVKVLEKVTSQSLLPLNMIELHHYSEF